MNSNNEKPQKQNKEVRNKNERALSSNSTLEKSGLDDNLHYN